MTFTKNIRQYILPALLVAAVLVSLFKPSSETIYSYAGQIQAKLNESEVIFKQATRSQNLFKALNTNNETAPVLRNIKSKGIFLFLYQNDSLLHWTTNGALLLSSPSLLDEGTSFLRLKNGWYQAMKYTDTAKGQILLGLVPVKYNYPFENKFLKNDFALGIHIPANIEVSEGLAMGATPVNNLQGKVLFSVYETAEERGDYVNWFLLLAQLTVLLVAFYYIQHFAVNIALTKGFGLGFAYLIVSILAIRTVMLWFNQPSELYRLELFHPKYYASSVVTKSLGDLLINSFMLMWVVLYWWAYRPQPANQPTRFSLPKAAFFIAIVFAFTGFVTWVFKTLVMDSVISFEVYNILSLNFYSLLGLVCIALVLIAHFLVARGVASYLQQSQISPIFIVTGSMIAGIAFSLFALNSQFYQSILFSAMWCVGFVLLLYRMNENGGWVPVRGLIIFISVYSLLSTYLIENLYERKERNQRKFFAGKLVSERDFIAEYMFGDVGQRIAADAFIKNYFSNPLIPQKEIQDRISSVYLSGYFNRYELKVYTYDHYGNSIRSRDTLPLSYLTGSVHTNSPVQGNLLYVTDTTQNYSYLAFFNFGDDSTGGTLALRLLPKVYYGQNVYPELLLGENISSLSEYSYYDYAVYQRDKLIMQHGDFPYSYYWEKDFQFGSSQYAYIDIGDWEHIIYRFANDKKVVVTIGQEGLFEPVATFSYLFSFFFMVVICLMLISRLWQSTASDESILNWFTISFRTRINYSMLLMIVTSFVIIGFITISFFRKQYDNFYSDRLLRKEKVVHASLEYFIQQNGGNTSTLKEEGLNAALSFEVARLAEINDIDISLYDNSGDLAVTSQPAIYDKGILSKKMNPDAYFELASTRGAQITEQENAGVLKYLATYAPVRNNAGQAIAYLDIPYFARSKNINDEVSSFLVSLMNVYVFLLICAAILAYFISNSVTRPLTIISEKLRILNLNKKNEPIEWKSNDEIGVLIGEYNKMIGELERSAKKLAKNERESAWREMAKQIAHEIKNPLTPMKLSIQYLQRAIDNGHPDIEQLAKKVTHTLNEQIENLASIATAFSSFAKMPKAQNELINLNELLKSIADLFAREEKTNITFTTESESPLVFADKNQLVSVFNNLVKNALQSIPEGRQGFVDINIKNEDGWVQASVSDNGSGIPNRLYDKVFVPNFTTKSSGTGLGLAITKQILEGAGGRIWFESAENVGTTFFVNLRPSESV